MTRILITGANSFIGTSFEKYIKNFDDYVIETIDMIDGSWKEKDFSKYEVVFHVAGIAHSDNNKISKEKEILYRKINTDLTIDVAKKAKEAGVKQFIFMSSAIVYGNSAPYKKEKIITKQTTPSPANCYGDSKLQAEKGIMSLEDDNYKVVILRPPMIYGKGCKGNYKALSKFAKKFPLFPKVKNNRSMLYIENLCEFIRLMIENKERGIFWPQNEEYVCTSSMVKSIAEKNNKKIILINWFNWLLPICSIFTGIINKVFGSLSYDKEISQYKQNYNVCDFEESIRRTEMDEI